MLEIQLRHIEKMITQMEAMGAMCLVKLPDGSYIGGRPGDFTETAKAKRPRSRTWEAYQFKARLGALTPGDVEVFEVLNGVKLSQLQSAVCSHAGALFGKGNYTTAQVDGKIQVLRTE